MAADLRIIRVVQALIDTSTVLAAYLLARRWLSPRASLFAAFIVAINPFLIYFTGLVLSETLFIAMLAWGMALLAELERRCYPRAFGDGASVRATSADLAFCSTGFQPVHPKRHGLETRATANLSRWRSS